MSHLRASRSVTHIRPFLVWVHHSGQRFIKLKKEKKKKTVLTHQIGEWKKRNAWCFVFTNVKMTCVILLYIIGILYCTSGLWTKNDLATTTYTLSMPFSFVRGHNIWSYLKILFTNKISLLTLHTLKLYILHFNQ